MLGVMQWAMLGRCLEQTTNERNVRTQLTNAIKPLSKIFDLVNARGDAILAMFQTGKWVGRCSR